jgi:hypothetical protein
MLQQYITQDIIIIGWEGNMYRAGVVPVLAQACEVSPGRREANLEFTTGWTFGLSYSIIPPRPARPRPLDWRAWQQPRRMCRM